MKVLYLGIQNFMRFGKYQRVYLKDRGLVGVFGEVRDSVGADSNGSGKSSLTTESILWCLWGKTLRNLKADDVINRDIGKDCLVEVVVEDGDKFYHVIRTRKMSKQKKSNDLQLFMYENEEAVGTDTRVSLTGGKNDLTQAMIDNILGIDYETFIHSVLLTGKTSFCSLTDSGQKKILEKILQFDLYAEAQRIAKDRLRDSENGLSLVASEIANTESRVGALKVRREEVEGKIDNFSQLLKEQIMSIHREKMVYVEELMSTLEVSTGQLSTVEASITDVEGRIQYAQDLVDIRRKKVYAIDQVKRDTVSKLDKNRAVVDHRLKELSKKLSGMSAIGGSECPVCKQEIPRDHSKDVEQELEAEAKKLQKTVEKLDKMETQVEELYQVDLDEINEEFPDLAHEIPGLTNKLNHLNSEKNKVQRSFQRIFFLDDKIEDCANRIEEKALEENPYYDVRSSIDTDLGVAEDKISELKAQRDRIEEAIKYLNFWVNGFGNQGIKSYLLDSVVPFLTERAQYYLNKMSDDTMFISFDTESMTKKGEARDRLHVNVVNSNGADVYEGNSDGEKRRIDFAVGWALADLASSRSDKSIKFRVLDEPFESLDSTGIDAVFGLLNSSTDSLGTILCVTHDSKLKNYFQNEIRVVKEDRHTRIEE